MSEQKEKELEEVIAWCEQQKHERGRVPIIERNFFQNKYTWARGKYLIEIDMPLEKADRNAFVYDSVLKCLWEWRNGNWAKVTKD
ncbi:hypothetical protein DRN67_02530 [Candidatus Micrarchaeota archaeon]|nr:MAG: hypothetical protein DRN67_02530 [Candidatus Micrarchaeota archaeon]